MSKRLKINRVKLRGLNSEATVVVNPATLCWGVFYLCSLRDVVGERLIGRRLAGTLFTSISVAGLERGILQDVLTQYGPELAPGWHFLDSIHVKVHADGSNPAGGQAAQAMGRTKGGLN